ncbi:MAG: hypothetical protein PHI45_01630 [Candidatus Pacebacteria bacterium]|nr:hypothetical protein [Candidatus Paceibacterota bacterium]MDD5013299.1 hypothetical protein [Candidatus Paceibacterota bacterium]MDD5752768.1 hypothetical protein [Candidatus Paceibacterota bacterium]
MKKRILSMIFVFLFVFVGNVFAADQTNVKNYLIQLLQSLTSGLNKASVVDVIDTGIFASTEIVSNNLSDASNPTIEFWAQAYCPNTTSQFKYPIPEGYDLVSCSYGPIGSHGGCSVCMMAKIKLIKKTIDPKINGVCGTANGHNYAANDTSWGSYTQCATGFPSVTIFPGNDTIQSWSCYGSNGGTNALCSAYRAKLENSGSCGSADGEVFTTAPTTNLCASGTASVVSQLNSTTWTWTCTGSDKMVHACRASSISISLLSPLGGESWEIGKTYQIRWTSPTLGDNKPIQISLRDERYSSEVGPGEMVIANTTNINGYYNWTIPSTLDGFKLEPEGKYKIWIAYGGLAVSPVTFNIIPSASINGACGSAHKRYSSTTTSYGSDVFCYSGTVNFSSLAFPEIGSSIRWSCDGINGGKSVSCIAMRVTEVTTSCGSQANCCGSSANVSSSTAPTSNHCANGAIYLGIVNEWNNQWTWQCNDIIANVGYSCFAPKIAATKINGTCGSINGTTVSSLPITNLCASGTASVVSGSGPWTWTCSGQNGGTSVSCSAFKFNYSDTTNIKVLAPMAGELIKAGRIYQIKWLADGQDPLNIALAKGNEEWHLAYSVSAEKGIYEWQVELGNTLTAGDNYRIHIWNNQNTNVDVYSNYFSISPLSTVCDIEHVSECTNEQLIDLIKKIMVVNGSCGSMNKRAVVDIPTTNLCASGTASVVSGSGPWTWTCSGQNGGTSVSCSAEKILSKPIPCGEYGDIDKDGVITYRDVILAFSGLENTTLNIIDVNFSHSADFNDIVMINNYLTGKISTFDVCNFQSMNLVSEWKLDGNANDSFGTNNGTVIGGGTYKTGFNDCVSIGCIQFDGTNDYIMIPDSSSMSMSYGGSVFLWVKPSLQYQQSYIIGQYPKTGNKSWAITIGTSAADKAIVSLSQDGINTNYSSVTASVLDNKWHLIGFTVGDDKLTTYVDGVKYSSVNINGAIYNSSANLLIGATEPSSGFFLGSIDDVKLFNKALSEEEVKYIYNSYNR